VKKTAEKDVRERKKIQKEQKPQKRNEEKRNNSNVERRHSTDGILER
jgi:hypothetical protein